MAKEENERSMSWTSSDKTDPESDSKDRKSKTVFGQLWTTHEKVAETEILNPSVLSKCRLAAHIVLIIAFISCCCFIFFSLGSPVTTTLEKSGGQEKWVPPDMIACPGHDPSRKYQVWYNQSLVETAGITPNDLDLLVDSVMTKKEDKTTYTQLALMANKLNITQTDPKELLKKVYHKYWYEGTKYRRCYYTPFRCDASELVWVLNRSLCLVWNNREMKTNKNIYIYLSDYDKNFEKVKFWIGNLRFKQIINWNSFTESLENSKFIGTPYFYYQLDKPKTTICQKSMVGFDSDSSYSCKIEKVTEFWAYDSVRVMESVIQSLRYEGKFFFKVRDIKVFNGFQVAEQIGGIGAILLGISCAKILVVPFDWFAKLLRSKKAKTIGRGFVWILLILLLAGLQYVDITGYLDTRYTNTTGSTSSSSGVEVPTVLMCGLIDRFLDYGMIEKYNVSYTMINLLSLSALYQFKFFEIDKVLKRNWELVKDPRVTEADIDEMFAFLSSPHENGLYSSLLQKYNKEYDSLISRLGFGNEKPNGFEVFSKFLKTPCELVEKCTAGKREVKGCCKDNFHYFNDGRSKLLCLMFDNKEGNVEHPQSGEDGGFRIFLNKTAFGEKKWYIGPRMASYINDTTDLYYRNREAQTYGTRLFSQVKVRQFGFSSGPYGQISEVQFQQQGAEYKFKYSAEKTTLLQHAKSHCSPNQQCYLYRYNIDVYAQMLIKKLCGCYICHEGNIPAFQSPCCETKHAYTCLTQPKFYAGFCDTNYYGPEFGIAYNDYVVNMYKEGRKVAKNCLGNTYGCYIRDWFYDNRSVFYGMIKDEEMSVDCREPCEKASYKLEGAEFVPGIHSNNTLVVNVFLSSVFIPISYELDNVSPFVLLSLIAGGIGLILGSSILDVFHFIFTIGERMKTQAGGSLQKIKKATAYFLSDENTLSSAVSRAILGLGLIVGAILCVLSSVYLEYENQQNPTTFKFFLIDADGHFPSVAVCSKASTWRGWEDVTSFQNQTECMIFGQSAECSKMFPLVLKQAERTCMVSNSSHIRTFKVTAGSRLEIRLPAGTNFPDNEELQVWVGDWGDIRDATINPQYSTETSLQVNYRIRSQQLLCCSQCQEYPQVTCPGCMDGSKKFCCLGEEGLTLASSPNISKEDPLICNFNILYSSVTIKYRPTYRSIAVQLAHTQMPVYVETLKLNWANKFSLYGGLVGIYLGLNFLNLFFYFLDKVIAKRKPRPLSKNSMVSTKVEAFDRKAKF